MSTSLLGSDGSRKYLSETERASFLKAAHKSKHKTFILFVAYTGCRVSEALRVRAMHLIDDGPGARSVILETLKQRKSGVFRTVPIPDSLFDMILRQHDLLSINPKKRLWPRTRQWGWMVVKAVATEARIFSCAACPKGLRHSAATWAVNRDVPIAVIQRFLGHSNPANTEIYANVNQATVRRHFSWIDNT